MSRDVISPNNRIRVVVGQWQYADLSRLCVVVAGASERHRPGVDIYHLHVPSQERVWRTKTEHRSKTGE